MNFIFEWHNKKKKSEISDFRFGTRLSVRLLEGVRVIGVGLIEVSLYRTTTRDRLGKTTTLIAFKADILKSVGIFTVL